MSELESEPNNPDGLVVEESVPALPGNFKSWDEVEKSRVEGLSALTRAQQETAALRAENEQYAQMVAQQNQPDPESELSQLSEQTGFDPETLRAFAMVSDRVTRMRLNEYQQQNGPQLAQTADTQNHLIAYTADQIVKQRVASEYGDDWDAMKGKVAEAIQQDPDLFPEAAVANPELTARALERVYKMVKADEVMSQIQSGQTPVDQGRQSKLNAQTMSGAAGRPGEPSDDEEWFARLKAANSQGWSARRSSDGW